MSGGHTTMSGLAHPEMIVLIDRHFARRSTAVAEGRLRVHLATCPDCRAYYDRHLLLERLDPSRPGPQRRLRDALGLPRRTRLLDRRVALSVAGLALAAAAALLAIGPWRSPVGQEFAVRGNSSGEIGQLLVYRLPSTGAPQLVTDEFSARDQLGFAYRNLTARRYLAVFAVDEHQHVYWYHPAWTSAASHPRSIAAETGPLLHELPEAISHDLDGHSLQIVALFTDQPLDVQEVERALATPGGLEQLRASGALVLVSSFLVRP
jgi:hypothetical protein